MKRTATIYSLTKHYSKVNDPLSEKRKRRKVVSPSESVIRNILNYSKALKVLTSSSHGYINLVMN
ncbi:MAG: hypothetical protein PHF97_08895 [Bacteroidales bacterium]|nr:hypothetical protein [Bacteroidales bacterium]MDD4603909.1 hypothetical protein [Bacteroidales bacterium]